MYTNGSQKSPVTQRGFTGAQTNPDWTRSASLVLLGLFWVLCNAAQTPPGHPATARCDQAALQAHHPTRAASTLQLLDIFQAFCTFRGVSR